jgi:hemolysin activation/secretion protein
LFSLGAKFTAWKGILFFIALILCIWPDQAGSAEEPSTFEIRSFVVEGNTLFPEKSIQDILQPYKGSGKRSSDVETARSALEKMYHSEGYPAVIVNIPEQTVQDGTIRLEVVESTIGSTRVTGNRWFTREKILRDIPSLAPGKILYVPDVQKDLAHLNRSSDLKVTPSLAPGKEAGTTDVTLKVEDNFPLHGSIELNNRSTHDTTDLRLNAMLRYDNLWHKDHSVAFQYQT